MEQTLSLAVCDDEKKEARQILRALEAESYPFDFQVELFSDGQALLARTQNKTYDLVFLDIEMPHINGFSLAETLRSFSEETEIVFVSSHEHLVYQSLGFRPFYFIRKAYLKEEIPQVLRSFWQKTERTGRFCEFRTATGTRRVKASRIIYMESLDHALYVHYASGVFSCRDQIGDREKELKDWGFVRIHRSYLVNSRYILRQERTEIIMKDGKRLPLSAGRKKAVRHAFERFSDGGEMTC